MSKKVFLGLFAATGMLLATSCSQDELEVPQSGNEAQVTFSLGLEGGHATRAISDGSGVNKLVYAVYKLSATNGEYELQPAVGSTTYSQFVKDDFKSGDNVSIPLAKGQTYRVAFWAQNSSCDAYNTDDLTAVSVDYADVNNNETRDAFFKTVEFTVEGSKTINVVLTRPFAQVNVGVTAEDWEAAVASGIEIEKSAVIINNAATAINLLTGEVSGEQAVSYTLNAIPKETLEAETDNTKEGKEQYHWLSMSYILVNETGAQDEDNDGTLGDAKTTLNGLTYTFAPESGENITFADGLNSVPVQRNYRTNIVGKILTGDIQFNITVDPVYDGEHIYPDGTVDDLQLAAAYGGTITLAEDIVLEDVLNITSELVVNLNGKTISGDFSDKAKTVINNTGKLTLIGGEIKNTATNGAAVITNSGKLVLKDVTINGAPIGTEGYPAYAVVTSGGELTVEEGTTISSDRGVIHMSNGANVTINGGNFEVTDAVGSRALTAHVIYAYGSSSKLTINGGDFAQKIANGGGTSVICPAGATIKVYGGNFYHVPVSDVQSGCFQNYMGYGAPVDVYGGTYNDNTVTKSGNLAEGYKAVEKDGKWYVVAGDVNAIVSNDTELQAAFAAGSTTVLMKAGTYDTKNFQVVGKTINLKGIEEGVRIYNSQNIDVASTSFDMCTVTFENLTIETLGGNYKGFARMNGTYKNCTIVNNYFTFYGKHLFENCTFNAPALTGSFKNEHCVWTYGAEEVDFVDCTFNYSDRCVNVYVDNGGNAPGITSDVEFTNCVFNTENAGSEGAVEVNSTPFTAGVKVVMEKCKAPAYGKMVYVSPWDGTKGKNATITVDGVVVAGLSSVLANAPKGSTIVLAEGVNLGEVTVGELKNVTILGSENTSMRFVTNADSKIENVTIKNIDFGFTTGTGQAGACVVINKDAEINNLVLDNITFVGDGNKNSYGITGQNSTASIIVKNCNFSNLGYAIQAISGGGYGSLTVEECTFDNIKSWAIMPQYGYNGDLTINNCTFKNSGGGLVKTGAFNGTFTFTNNTITSCTGHDGADSKWFEVNASAATKVIDGNIKDGAAWTPGEANGLK